MGEWVNDFQPFPSPRTLINAAPEESFTHSPIHPLKFILCPLDFSAATPGLVAYAAALAAATGAELRLLHVREPWAGNFPTPLPGANAAVTPDAEQLARCQVAAEQAGAGRVSVGTLRGEAAPEIVAEANRRHADLIIIGAHGQTGLTRFLMGNTAEVVLRTASCPTLLVRALPTAA